METLAMHLFSAQTLAAIFGTRLDKASRADSALASEKMTENEIYSARGAELAKAAQKRRRVGLVGRIRAMWSGTIERAIRTQRELEHQENLIERLEAFPPYLLNDIGICREADGRLIVTTETGEAAELFSAAGRKTPTKGKQAAENRNDRASCAAE